MPSLFQRSIQIILDNQTPSGAFLACPNFPIYRFSWFRDGTFIAHAMDLVGEHASAERFHTWAAGAISERADVVARAEEKMLRGETLAGAEYLHTRYTVDGQEDTTEEWPNFQLDGFGTWLWGLNEHLRLSGGALRPELAQGASLAGRYLAALWQHPCYDCWEEFPSHIHTYTLAAIYGGLQACTALGLADYHATCAEIRQYVETHLVYDGYFVKFDGSYTVDASLLGLSTPYGMFSPADPRMRETVRRITASLESGGGVHRYPTDTYFGGGEWVLLAGWLGWHEAAAGDTASARCRLDWMAAQANLHNELPEQVPCTLNDPNYYEPWRRRWGEIARPLLWSHAKYIILKKRLESGE